MRRLLALLTVVALLFAACGDDGGSDDNSSDGNEQSTDGATAGDEALPNDAELDTLLLTAADLGDKWAEDPGSRSVVEEDEETPECLQDPPNDPDHEKAGVSFTFDPTGTGAPSLQQQVTDYHDLATMTAAFDAATSSIDSCGEFTYGPDDSKVSARVESIDGPTVGDASRTWALHLSAQGLNFTAYILYARVGQLGTSVQYLSQGTPDLEAFGGLVTKAIAKL